MTSEGELELVMVKEEEEEEDAVEEEEVTSPPKPSRKRRYPETPGLRATSATRSSPPGPSSCLRWCLYWVRPSEQEVGYHWQDVFGMHVTGYWRARCIAASSFEVGAKFAWFLLAH